VTNFDEIEAGLQALKKEVPPFWVAFLDRVLEERHSRRAAFEVAKTLADAFPECRVTMREVL
jgi:hypothetical protein